MEAVTAARFTFEYRYPNVVNQDQEQRASTKQAARSIGDFGVLPPLLISVERKFCGRAVVHY